MLKEDEDEDEDEVRVMSVVRDWSVWSKYSHTFQWWTSQGVLIVEMLGLPQPSGSLICKYKESCKNTTCCSRLNTTPQKYLESASLYMDISVYMCRLCVCVYAPLCVVLYPF